MERTVADTGRKATRKQGLALFLAVTVLFVILYFPCIFQGKLYGYHDIGRDTENQYLPNMVYALRSIKAGESDVYKLDRGLGEYYPSLLYKYVNGVNIPLLIFGEKYLAWGLLSATYLKYLVIALFSWLFFRHLLGKNLIPLCCALAWTYCSYAVLWGQHYHLLTSICAFTIEVYGLQLYLENDRKSFLLIPAVACMAYTGYFYLWMGSFFVLGYSLCYLIFQGEKPLAILKKALICILCFLWACLISGEYMLPGIQEFIESTRGSGIANSSATGGIFYGIEYLYAFMARLLSPNLLGVGDTYHGPTNYYEIAFTGMGLVFLFAIGVLLTNQKTLKRTIGLIVLCIALTCSPMVSRVFSMRATTQRWSFILQFTETICIGFGLKRLFESSDMPHFKRNTINALVIMDLLFCAIAATIWFGQARSKVNVDGNYFIEAILLLLSFNVFLILVLEYLPAWTFSLQDFKTIAAAAIIFVVCTEIVLTDYPAINNRKMITRNEWENSMYYDGTQNLVQAIAEEDNSLYRVSKNYESVSRNDALIQSFNGTSVYNSLNAHWLVNYYAQMGYNISNSSTATGSNYIRFSENDEIETALLCVKYLIKHITHAPLSLQGYTRFLRDEESRLIAYKNELMTSFGYFYDQQLDYDSITEYGVDYMKACMTKGYFNTVDLLRKTEEGTDEDSEDGEGSPIKDADDDENTENVESAENESEEEENSFELVNDPETGFYTKELLDKPSFASSLDCSDMGICPTNRPLRIYVTINAPKELSIDVDFMAGTNKKNSTTVSETIKTSDGRKQYTVEIETIRDMRSLLIRAEEPVWFESVILEYYDNDVIIDNLKQLFNNGRVDLSQQGNAIAGTVNNPGAKSKMLCVPLIYNQHWHALLDGTELQIQNINGGLIGLEVDPGEHTVELTYRDSLPHLGRMIGAISFGLYLICLAFYHLIRRRRKNTDRTHTGRQI